jgi:hypothetical protein
MEFSSRAYCVVAGTAFAFPPHALSLLTCFLLHHLITITILIYPKGEKEANILYDKYLVIKEKLW